MAEGKEQAKHSKWYHRAVGFGAGAGVAAVIVLAQTSVDAPGVRPVAEAVSTVIERGGRIFNGDETPTTTTAVTP